MRKCDIMKMEGGFMGLKTKLIDEKLFSQKEPLFFEHLEQKGIYTVEDYINADIKRLALALRRRHLHEAYRKILKYKYLGEPLVFDVLLEKKYGRKDESAMINDFRTLGFSEFDFLGDLRRLLVDLNPKDDYVKMIDIINNLPYMTKHINTKNFYIEYYNNVMKQEVNDKDVKDVLESLKNELVILTKKSNELDKKISLLLEQINTFEGEKNINGKK